MIIFIICMSLAISGFIMGFIVGYKNGEKDANMDWVEKEEYYQWLLDMKRAEDYIDGRTDIPINDKQRRKKR